MAVPAQPVGASRHLSWRWPLGAGLVLLVVFLVGGRELFGHTLPAVGSLPQTQGGPGSWWHLWWSGWRPDGLGSDASPPPALWLLAVAGTLLGGATGTLQHVLVLGPLVVGAWGAWRTARHFGSRPGRVAALVVYAMVAVPFDALARGRWAGLVLYAAAPWLVSALARATGAEPFASPDRRGQQLAALRLGLLVALVGAFAPAVLGLLVPVVAVGLIGGLVITGEGGRSRRVLLVAVAATVVAIVLLLPWSARTVSSTTALFGVGGGAPGRLGLGQLLRFDTGPVGGSVLGWGFLVAAALPLVIGRSWRLAWAGRFWVLAIWCCGIDWAGSRGWLPVSFGDPDVLLALAAAALAFSACLGVVAFDTDLPGYRFGWRQLVSGVAAVAVVVGALPALAGATDGRWHLPSADANAALLLPAPATGDYRVLWVGDPAGIPAGSWRLEDGVGYATSTNGEPTVAESWPPVSSGATPLLAADLRLARGQDTTRLGHLLGPMAVRYIVVPNHNAPSGSDAAPLAVPNDLLQGLSRQTDLQVQTPDPNYTVYVNTAWSPGTALLGPAAAEVARSSGGQPAAGRPQRIDEQTQQTRLSGTRALAGGLTSNTHGSVPSGSSLYVAASRSGRWSLHVGGTGPESGDRLWLGHDLRHRRRRQRVPGGQHARPERRRARGGDAVVGGVGRGPGRGRGASAAPGRCRGPDQHRAARRRPAAGAGGRGRSGRRRGVERCLTSSGPRTRATRASRPGDAEASGEATPPTGVPSSAEVPEGMAPARPAAPDAEAGSEVASDPAPGPPVTPAPGRQ